MAARHPEISLALRTSGTGCAAGKPRRSCARRVKSARGTPHLRQRTKQERVGLQGMRPQPQGSSLPELLAGRQGLAGRKWKAIKAGRYGQ